MKHFLAVIAGLVATNASASSLSYWVSFDAQKKPTVQIQVSGEDGFAKELFELLKKTGAESLGEAKEEEYLSRGELRSERHLVENRNQYSVLLKQTPGLLGITGGIKSEKVTLQLDEVSSANLVETLLLSGAKWTSEKSKPRKLETAIPTTKVTCIELLPQTVTCQVAE
jgi:hypothetical protein